MTAAHWEGVAPGRLDVLGGVADYSGSLVLQTPIRATTRVTVTAVATPRLEVVSAQAGTMTVPLPPPRLLAGDAAAVRAWLDEVAAPHWSRYSLGCFVLFCQDRGWRPDGGLRFDIVSDVPVSLGVSSSAALEVATLRALELASGRRFSGTALARLGQRAENEVVGAPCGLMDQLAAAHGEVGALLPILCRPDGLEAPVPLPAGATVVGWPSGVRHAVTASPYASARTASFMGKKILESILGRRLGHVTELPPSLVRGITAEQLPAALSGREFLARHGGVDDPLSRVDPARDYPVRAGASFPVEENFRATLAVRLLRGLRPDDRRGILEAVGELMYQAHAGYGSIGLGCPETDQMVEAIRALGAERGCYGARVSGGGSGGTVVVLLEEQALPELERLAATLTFADGGPARLIR